MQIDTAGTYTLKYTAEDECGNITEVTREVEAVQITYRTVLYTDGTFIINEKSTDINANVAEHGVATNVYAPWENVRNKRYEFGAPDARPWHNEQTLIQSVKIGSIISPTQMNYWFYDCTNLDNCNLDGIDASDLAEMQDAFRNTKLNNLYVGNNFKPTNLHNARFAFQFVKAPMIDLTSWGTLSLNQVDGMFRGAKATTIDISVLTASSILTAPDMFNNCSNLVTILVSDGFDLRGLSSRNGQYMFADDSRLVGGQGTRYNSDYYNNQRACIDNPPDLGYFTLKSA